MESVKGDQTQVKAEISARFKQARAALNLSPTELGRELSISPQTVRDYEDEKSIPGGAAIRGLVLKGINSNWLLTGAGPMRLSDLAAGKEINIELLKYVTGYVLDFVRDTQWPLPADKVALVIAMAYQLKASGSADLDLKKALGAAA